MKDTEREKTTAELAAWQLRQKQQAEEEAKLQSQTENQNKVEVMAEKQGNGRVKMG